MNSLLKTISLAALLSGSAGWALADPVVSNIEVEAQFESVDTDKAAAFWPSVESDLKDVLSDRLAPYAGENGVDVKVSIRQLSLDASATDATYRDVNGIEGVVAFRGADDKVNPQGFRIAYSVLPPGQTPIIPGAIVVPPDTGDNYAALISAVADQVESQVKDLNM